MKHWKLPICHFSSWSIVFVMCLRIVSTNAWGNTDQAFYEKFDMAGVPFVTSLHKVTVGDSAVLHCSFDAMPRQYMLLYGYDSLLLEWVKVMPDGKGKLIAVGSRLRTLEPRYQVIRVPGHKALSILVIRDIKHSDSGQYRCHLSLATMRHRYFELQILDPSLSVTHNDTSIKMKEGQSLTLQCNTSGYPPPMVHWTRRIKNGNNQWASGEYFVWGNTAKVTFLHSQDSGIYSCHIDNFVSRRLQINFDVTVAVRPQFLEVYQNGINVGGLKSGPWWPVPEFDRPFTLMCQTQAKSPVVMHWFKNGQPFKKQRGLHVTMKEQNKKSRLVQTEIFFRQFQKTDLGAYMCRATNPAGSLHYTFRLDSMKGYNYPYYKKPPRQQISTARPSGGVTETNPLPPSGGVTETNPLPPSGGVTETKYGSKENEDDNNQEVGSGFNNTVVQYITLPKPTISYDTKAVPKLKKDPSVEKENETEKQRFAINNRIDDEDDIESNETEPQSGDGAGETLNEIPPRDGSGVGPSADEVREARRVNKTKVKNDEMYI